MSEHEVKVVRVEQVLPHDNADSLEIVPVNGWQAVVRKGQYNVGDLAVYIEPDYVVPVDLEEFSFLKKNNIDGHRLKAVRLRGELSYGLLIPISERFKNQFSFDQNVIDVLGIKRYEPPIRVGRHNVNVLSRNHWPKMENYKYDLENYQKFPDLIKSSEVVYVTEKIHGANARYTCLDDELFIGSRRQWLKRSDVVEQQSAWERALTSEMESWCRSNPGSILYGEIYGNVQSLKYGYNKDVKFRAFSVFHTEHAAPSKALRWMHSEEFFGAMQRANISSVPVLYYGDFDIDCIKTLVERDSVVADRDNGIKQIMEGGVIVPEVERMTGNFGRVALKLISNNYWTSGK